MADLSRIPDGMKMETVAAAHSSRYHNATLSITTMQHDSGCRSRAVRMFREQKNEYSAVYQVSDLFQAELNFKSVG